MDVSVSCVCPVIDNEFRHNIVKVVCGSTRLIIPFALVGYETDYNQLGATRLVGYLPSHIQRALME